MLRRDSPRPELHSWQLGALAERGGHAHEKSNRCDDRAESGAHHPECHNSPVNLQTISERGTRMSLEMNYAYFTCPKTQSPIVFRARGDIVSSIFAYSVTAPVSDVWNKWFNPGSFLIV